MGDRIKYIVQLADKKNPAIKSIGQPCDTLSEAEKIRNKRKIQPNQHLWIGKYVNGVLRESY